MLLHNIKIYAVYCTHGSRSNTFQAHESDKFIRMKIKRPKLHICRKDIGLHFKWHVDGRKRKEIIATANATKPKTC